MHALDLEEVDELNCSFFGQVQTPASLLQSTDSSSTMQHDHEWRFTGVYVSGSTPKEVLRDSHTQPATVQTTNKRVWRVMLMSGADN